MVKVRRLYLAKDRESDAVAHPRIRRPGGHLHHLRRVRRAPGSTRRPGRRRSPDAPSPSARPCRSATWRSSSAGSTPRRSAPLVADLRDTLDSLVEIGLGYLSLDRESATLSGGEAQRVKMVRHLGSSLSDVTYVFDEPTVGLHPHDITRMNDLLLRLRDKGNTVLVVEHKPETIAIADHVVDLGPGAGAAGGRICFTGDVAGLRRSDTLTGRHLDHRVTLRTAVRTAHRSPADPRGRPAQPARRRRGPPAGGAHRGHRRGRLGQELTDPRLAAPSGRGRGRRPVRRSGAPGAATRRPRPACSTRSAPRSPAPTGSRPRCSAPTPRAPARPVRESGWSTPTWPRWPPSPPSARRARGGASPPRCWHTPCAAGTSARCSACR